jgi:hypothetical protein
METSKNNPFGEILYFKIRINIRVGLGISELESVLTGGNMQEKKDASSVRDPESRGGCRFHGRFVFKP